MENEDINNLDEDEDNNDEDDSCWRDAIFNEFGYKSTKFKMKKLNTYFLNDKLPQRSDELLPQSSSLSATNSAIDYDGLEVDNGGSNNISISKFNNTGQFIKSIQPNHQIIVLNNRINKMTSVRQKFTDKQITSNFYDVISNLKNELKERDIKTAGDALTLLDTIRKTIKSKNSKNAQILLGKMIDAFHKSAINEPSYEDALKEDVDYFKSIAVRQERAIKSVNEKAKRSRAKYGEISDTLYELEKKHWNVENEIDAAKNGLKDSERTIRLLNEDISMLKSEMKYGCVSDDIQDCIEEAAKLSSETFKIIHDLQQIEGDNKAIVKITEAYLKELEEERKTNVPRSRMQDLERELKMLNMKKTIFQENSEPEEKMHFDFSKKLYIKEQQCAAMARRLKFLTKEKTEFLAAHTPRPKWQVLRNKVDLINYRKFMIGTIDARIPIWSKDASTKKKVKLIVKQLHSYIKKARTKESNTLHHEWEKLEKFEHNLARWVGSLPEKKQFTEEVLKQNEQETEHELISAGDRPDVPLCLRCSSKLKFAQRRLPLTHVRNEIRVILKAKATFDHAFGAISMPNFLHDYSRLEYDDPKHGGPKGFAYNFINSVRKYRKYDGLCEMFYEVFRLRWKEAYLHDIENMFGELLTRFERAGRRIHGSDHDHDGTLPLDAANSVLKAFFPMKLDEDLEDLRVTLEAENKKMHKLLMVQSLESHCPECQSYANENRYQDPECIYYRHIFAHYYGLPVCAAHAASTAKKKQVEEEEKALKAEHYLPFFKRGYFGLYSLPKSHEQHEDTHGKHHLSDIKFVSKSKKDKTNDNNIKDVEDKTKHGTKTERQTNTRPKLISKRGKYKQRKISFLDLLTHQYKAEVNEFIERIHDEMLKLDWSDNLLLPKFQVIRAIKAADRFLPNNVVHKYYSNGIIDLYYNNQKRKSAEDLVDIDMFINNLRYSYTRPYDIYKDAVVDHLDHENVRAVLSFGSLNLGATDSMQMHHED